MKRWNTNVVAFLVFCGFGLPNFHDLNAQEKEDPFKEINSTTVEDDPFAETKPGNPSRRSIDDPFADPADAIERPRPKPVCQFSIDLKSDLLPSRIGQFGNERCDKIFEVLARRVRVDFFEARFGDVKNEWQSNAEINIVLDESAADNQLDEEALITRKLDDLPFSSALRIIVREWDCDYVIKDEILIIMSQDKAKQQQIMMMYDCRDLVKSLQGDPEAKLQQASENDPNCHRAEFMGEQSRVGWDLRGRRFLNCFHVHRQSHSR